MSIAIIENVIMLLAAVGGLLLGLFRYISMPKRGWLYVTVFFLCHILSDYYWTIYTLVMQRNPDVSAFTAYFGWNIGYVVLLLLAIHMRPEGSKRYFHPLMLLPIPLNIWQFTIYYPFGGLANNIWQVGLTTAAACISLQSLLYYLKNRKNGTRFPFTQLFILLFVIMEYGKWTVSCFDWPSELSNPYYYFSFAGCFIMLLFAWAVGKDYYANGLVRREKTSEELRFQTILQFVACTIILGGCTGGYFLALWMKNTLLAGTVNEGTYGVVAVVLFLVSIFLALLILAVMFLVAIRYKKTNDKQGEPETMRRRRTGFLLTTLITFGLMVFSVIFSGRLFYRVSVTGIYNIGEDMAETMGSRLQTYLSDAKSILQVASDTVNLMIRDGEPNEKLHRYLKYQTSLEKDQFDENLTGFYAYSRGEYLDGIDWIPPEGYDPTERDWYKEAVAADGDTVITPPYVDAQTQDVVITICRRIADASDQENYQGHNVMALDVIVNRVQEITEETDVGGKGFAFVITQDGLIVAHHDPSLTGETVKNVYGSEFLMSLPESGSCTVDTTVNGEDCTLFINRFTDQWYAVILVNDSELLENVYAQLTVSILVSLVIFALISFFYMLAYRNEKAQDRQMEEMRAEQHRREYEAQVLKLEKKSADEANKAKSSFLADMSHEIRTPINAILGMNELILRDPSGEHTEEYAKNIADSGQSLLSLVNTILDFSKIEEGKMEIVPQRYNTKSMITQLVNSVSERAKAKNLAFQVKVDPDLPSELYGDDAKLSQIILNLLTNAIKYTPEGSVTFTVKEKEHKDGEALVYVEVRDTGIGIREDEKDKLFESFERLDVVRNRTIEGTGLGLSIVTRLLRLMGSELNVESVYGEGSVFSFALWQVIENRKPVGDYQDKYPEEKPVVPETGRLYAPDARILITDDTKLNIVVAVNLLKSTEIRIDTAYGGEEAVSLAEKNTYDLILMDQRMPGIDGTETMKRIRSLGNGLNRETPVICLTADAIKGAREKYLAEGFTDYLTKPVTGQSLEQMLYAHLPKDKIRERTEAPKEEETNAARSADNELYEALKEVGVKPEAGLRHTQDDHGIYQGILTEFAKDGESRRKSMEQFYVNKDWDNYLIYAHSLKSTAKTIGAESLSELAAGLEAAAKEKNATAIEKDHPEALKQLKAIVDVLWEKLDINENADSDQEDAGMFEFAPEE